jgi:3-oxoacyl-[acyl-carrier-protein] synthase I
MPDVFIAADNIVSPLGLTTAENFSQLVKGVTGVKEHADTTMSELPFYASLFAKNVPLSDGNAPLSDGNVPLSDRYASQSEKNELTGLFDKNALTGYTKFEHLLIASIRDALGGCRIDPRDKKTILIISSTKGNISLLETGMGSRMNDPAIDPANYLANAAGTQGPHPASDRASNTTANPASNPMADRTIDPALAERISLYTSAKLVSAHFGFINPPIVVSNACISGIMGILTAMRLIGSGRYEHAVVAGADVISRFILSGFQAFQAISPGICKPFDRDRSGINLGEGAGTLILSSHREYADGIKVMGGAISNDANHLSAPSRTGEELSYAMTKALREARLLTTDIDFISAHGTATVYNDEMEARAIALANLQAVPVNSLKGYYGHTLGAAGLIESIVSVHSLKQNLVLPTLGFEQIGVTRPLNICTELQAAPLQNCLKTASGFGGCNAALVLSKNEI